MDAKLALDNIKEAEAKANTLIEQARKEAQDILQAAGLKKAQIIKEAEGQALSDAQQLKDKLGDEAAQEIALIVRAGEEEVRLLREKAQRNLERAVEFIKEKIG